MQTLSTHSFNVVSKEKCGFESRPQYKKTKMSKSKIEKKKLKLQERIKFLEDEMIESLTKKTSDTKEINVPLQQRKIHELKIELSKL